MNSDETSRLFSDMSQCEISGHAERCLLAAKILLQAMEEAASPPIQVRELATIHDEELLRDMTKVVCRRILQKFGHSKE